MAGIPTWDRLVLDALHSPAPLDVGAPADLLLPDDQSASRELAPTAAIAAPRSRHRRVEMAAFGLYILVLVIGVAHHEPWADEVQSWLLARDLSPLGLAVHQLRYEGSPGLWQFILLPFAHAHLPVITLNIVGAAIAAVGVALLIFLSPLPLVLRITLPFSYYLMYQYAVIARSYNLLIPLVFGLAAVFARRFDRPLLYIGLLALLSAVSVESMAVAAALFLAFLFSGYKLTRSFREFCAQFQRPILLFVGVEVALVAILWPTADNSAPLATSFVTDPSQVIKSFPHLVFGSSLVGVPWINAPLLISLSLWLATRKRFLQFAAPFTASVLFSAIKLTPPWQANQPWFAGMNILLLLFAVWIALESRSRWHLRVGNVLSMTTLSLVFVASTIQVWWSISALNWDANQPYGNGKEIAGFLAKHNLLQGVIATAGQYAAIDVEPYLLTGQFANLPVTGAYFHYSKAHDFSRRLFEPMINKTAEVIISTPQGWSPSLHPPTPKFAGYRVVAEFNSEVFWPDSAPVLRNGFNLLIYLRNDLSLGTCQRDCAS